VSNHHYEKSSFNPIEATITMEIIHNEEQFRMTQVVLGDNEGIDSALRRFKRQVSKAGILADVKYHRHFETPIEKRKRKAVAARRKRRFN
jgi:small subunit ribosomal protein S21